MPATRTRSTGRGFGALGAGVATGKLATTDGASVATVAALTRSGTRATTAKARPPHSRAHARTGRNRSATSRPYPRGADAKLSGGWPSVVQAPGGAALAAMSERTTIPGQLTRLTAS